MHLPNNNIILKDKEAACSYIPSGLWFNLLSPNINIQILQTDLHTFP